VRYSRVVGWLSMVVATLAVGAQAEPITQEQFLDHLKQSHPLFDREKLTAQIEAEEQKSLLGREDWNVQSSLFLSHEEPALAISGPERTDAVTLTGGLDRLFWSTGGRLSASFSSGYADMKLDPFLGVGDSFYEQKLFVAYEHPLKRNKAGLLDRLQFDLKQFDIDLAEVMATENEEDFLAAAASRFLDWVYLNEQHRIVAERLSLSQEQLANTQKRREANLIDEVDVIRAEDAVRIARQNLFLIESETRAVQAELAVLVQNDSYNEGSPRYDLYQIVQLPTLEDARGQLTNDSRLLKSVGLKLDQLVALRSGLVNREKADLSLVAQLGLKRADENLGQSLAMDKPEARLGLRLGFPLGNRTAKSEIARNDLLSLRLQKRYEELTLDLTSATANVHTRIKELTRVLKLNQEQILSARTKTDQEQKLYDQGRGQLTFVIQSRDSEQAAQLIFAANALTYHKLLLQYRALTDQLHGHDAGDS